MDIFDILTLMGGLCLFLFGMNIMGQSLERRAGNGLKSLLKKLSDKKFVGLLTGLVITAIIQSSSATTVMVVGFVNSGLMTLRQSINVIMGANIGTTVTAWIHSLAGIESDNFWVSMLKPSSFTPILALIGIIFIMFQKNDKKKDTGMVFLGFATLMFGMETMSDAVSGLRGIPQFQQLFITFANPVWGVLAGALLTAIIQSSSASVGVLQVLASTGAVSFGAAVPIIMGQNIGTCVTAILSSIGTNKNAKRAALVHLSFNVIGTIFWLAVFCIIKNIFTPALLNESVSLFNIAVIHSVFNLLCMLLLFPFDKLLEKLVCILVKDAEEEEKQIELDERLLVTPSLALAQSRATAVQMSESACSALKKAIFCITNYSPARAQSIREEENKCDHYEDILGTYLIKVSSAKLGRAESEETTALLKIIGDFERISDHAVNILESSEELRDKKLTLTEEAMKEFDVLTSAICEVLDLTLNAFSDYNVDIAEKIEPLEQVIDDLKEKLRTGHIVRMKEGKCSAEIGFIWLDLLTDLERVSDHCSNVAEYITDISEHTLNVHEKSNYAKTHSELFIKHYNEYSEKYSV